MTISPMSWENVSVAAPHRALADELKREGHIQTAGAEAAFRAIARHLFLPGVPLEKVYCDEAIITKHVNGLGVSSSSQPSVMATMLEQLKLEPGHRVLEIGAGTGYNAALMAHIVGDTGQIVTIDIDEDIVEAAREHLAAAGFRQVQVVCGDGGLGYADGAPYDRIVLAVGAWDIAPAWTEQLKPGGLLLTPLSLKGGAQKTVAFQQAEDHLASVSISDCSFIPLRGAFAGPEGTVQLGREPGLYIGVEDRSLVDAEATYKSLTSSPRDRPTGIRATKRDIWRGLNLWLALREPRFCYVGAHGKMTERDIVPCLFRLTSDFCSTVGLLGEAGICVLMHPPDKPQPCVEHDDSTPFDLWVRSFGPGDALTHRLIEQVTAWDTAGRPATEGLSIRAYPKDSDYVPSANETVIVKRWTRLGLRWQ